MKTKLLSTCVFLILAFAFFSFSKAGETNNDPPKFWAWMGADASKSDAHYAEVFHKYKAGGLDAVLINTNADPELLRRLTPLATKAGLEVHAWMFTVNRPGDAIAEQHPEWYAVSRDGKSCYDDPPYVGYYKWLCPTREESKAHILKLVEQLAAVEGVSSVHLDYIRYSDIFLPIGLLPKYNLEQETELARYDFCYCDVCRAEFEKIHHKVPQELDNPAIDMEWKNFRLNRIRAVVNEAYEIVHKYGKQLTAAVFPYPEMADHMVRQRWDKWDVDMVLPMIYHGFYLEDLDWIGYATRQGVSDLKYKPTSLHTGLFIPDLDPSDLRKAIKLALDNGAKGVALFDASALTPEHLAIIREFK
ncbi:putative glycoside hydrolase [Zeaxanthinibacter enoshimensis]|uniref:Putative glycosyl hydrolase protein n=1 Tax=Zeaxanthinibacter enoshimensis TaxID=392009 RepID=A0A4R6TKQ2_9FLAO|nr:putative glycoside hydrolase [Zeaxanthinibacter enoshimensis]TDQ31052.1 putative glycosyl hydrolase protein [Zeaxanthinibacter enoshimensis]